MSPTPQPPDGQHRASQPPIDPRAPQPPTACAVCGYVLNTHTLTAYGRITDLTYHHTPAQLASPDFTEHVIVPVLVQDIRTNFLCDFCLSPNARWSLPTENFETAPGVYDVDGWAACDDCAPALQHTPPDWESVITRALHAQRRRGNTTSTRADFRNLYTQILQPHITGPLRLGITSRPS